MLEISAASCTSPKAPRERLSESTSWSETTFLERSAIFSCALSISTSRLSTSWKTLLVFSKPLSSRSSTLPPISASRRSLVSISSFTRSPSWRLFFSSDSSTFTRTPSTSARNCVSNRWKRASPCSACMFACRLNSSKRVFTFVDPVSWSASNASKTTRAAISRAVDSIESSKDWNCTMQKLPGIGKR